MSRLSLVLAIVALSTCGTPTTTPEDSGTTTNGSDAGGSTLTAEQLEWINAHDSVRAGAMPAPSPALEKTHWSANAAALALDWVARCDFNHRDPNSLGENLFASTGPDRTPTSIVDSWASEKANYTYASNSCAVGKVCGHYTQLVWRQSTGIGCAQKTCTTGSPFGSSPTWQFTVCDYEPAGNFVGRPPY